VLPGGTFVSMFWITFSAIVMTEDGDLVLVKASAEKLQEVSRVPVLQGKTWNYPAIDNGRLLVRNTTEMAAFKIP